MDIKISDEDIKGFNDKAQNKLIEATSEFVNDLIEESNRLEASRNTTGDDPQITSNMVNDARVLLRRGLSQPKKKFHEKLLRIVAVVLSLLVGISYDSIKLQDSGYMLIFIVLLTAAILTVTISTIRE